MVLETGDADELRRAVAAAYRDVCVLELAALKPGNVHRYADGHGMCVADFLASAEASAGPLAEPGLGLGERIFRAVEATRARVGCNTNLGILLLCAPLVQAVLEASVAGDLRARLAQVLRRAERDDADWVFRAIRLAAPAGLGRSEHHDVAAAAVAPLAEVMAYAAPRDRIAWQYATDFAGLFAAARLFADLEVRWGDAAWAASALFMDLLARHPDTHITRKQGEETAFAVSRRALPLAAALLGCAQPAVMQDALLRLDQELKRDAINPGTTADLTVAALFIGRLGPLCPFRKTTAEYCRIPGPGAVAFGSGVHHRDQRRE
jgi:triphosphoribosyl-dephospho-CoA synthase